MQRPVTHFAATAVLILTVTASAGEIRWRSGRAPTPAATPAEVADSIEQLIANRANAPTHFVIQFGGPVTTILRQQVQAAGVTLLNYLGDNAFFAVTVGSTLARDQLGQIAGLSAALPVEQVWKLHPDLVADRVLPWMLAGADAARLREAQAQADPAEESVALPTALDDPEVAAYVLFHPDVDLGTRAVAIAARHGAVVRSELRTVNGLVVELPYSSIKSLATEDAVQYIEPPLPRFEELNDSNRAITGAEQAQAAPYNLDGGGVRVMIYDGGTILASHPDFGTRARIGDSDGLSDHATHVAGTVGGDGSVGGGVHRGMAPAVDIDSYGFETGGPLEQGFLYTDPGDLEADYGDSVNLHGAAVTNNSIGTNTAQNGFPCSWEGDYGVTSVVIDAIVRGGFGAHRVVWANGNERGNGSCGTGYQTTAPPACAKNHITVGALNSNNDTVTSFTSWGPADDGRMKPDVSAPGCQSNGDNGVTSTSSAGSYNVKCGTSMASPTVTGLAALLIQDFRQQFPGEPDMRNSTLKALLAHTAFDLENPGPDHQTGYGSVRVVPAIDQLRSGNFLESTVAQASFEQVLVVVAPGETALKVTLAWDDVPGTPNVDPALVNDLDLVVLDAAGTPFFPWTLDGANPANNAVRTHANRVDNIEQVLFDNPVPGSYLVQIVGFNVPQGPQPFSLVASSALINCSPRGLVKLDRLSYRCDGTMNIEIIDCDLNTDHGMVETVAIVVDSTSEPGGETVMLVESGPETAQFVGTIGLHRDNSPGLLQIVAGDLVSVTYIDADDGFGGVDVPVVTTAEVDCSAPLITNVGAANIDPRSAVINFDTDEVARAEVAFGTSCGLLAETASALGFNTVHSVNLAQLADDTTYYYAVLAEDPAGNVTYDDNGGACYAFTTPDIPDYITEQFTGGFDLVNQALLFAPNGSVDFYGACGFSTLVLPTDPTGGTVLSLADTGSATVALTGGQQVLLYGVSYSEIHVNANGNLTFEGADSDSTESLDDHFEQPRVAALFDDLDPSEGGVVSWKQLSDRFVVTWSNVPEDNAGNSNTFQIEMYYDGRIQVAWLNIAATDGLVGLSGGGGVPIDFLPTDLSESASCGPRPPSAAGRTVVLGQDRSTDVVLLASDDGLPAPASLAYIVTALPTYELRDAGNGLLITPLALPYTLVDGGGTVTYAPTDGFVGVDSFAFKAYDGGVPPDAGDSNEATVVLKVDPVLHLPFFDDFGLVLFDDYNWSNVTGATVDELGIDEPSPPYAARLNGTPSGGDQATTHLIDLLGTSSARVRYAFQHTGNGESPDAGDNLFIEYLGSNGAWTILRQYAGDGPDMTTFTQEDELLPADALHDSFRLRLRSNGTASSSSMLDDWFVDDVIISVAGAPLASSSQVTAPQDGERTITLAAMDPDGDPLDFLVVELPEHGTLAEPSAPLITLADLPYTFKLGVELTYTPAAGYAGPDQLRFKAFDGTFDSNTATVQIFVEPVLAIPFEDDFPTNNFDVQKWADVSGATIDGVGLDEPTPPYAARLNGEPTAGDSFQSFAIDLSGHAEIIVEYKWQRTGGGDSPEGGDDLYVEFFNDNSEWEILALHLGSDPDMTTFALAQHLLPTTAYHPDFRIRFGNDATVGDFDDWFIDDLRVYSADAPSASDQTVGVPRFGGAELTLIGADPNDRALTYLVTSLPAHGQLYDPGTGLIQSAGSLPVTLADAEVLYLADLGFAGDDGFTFHVINGEFTSNEAAVVMTVGGVQPVVSFPMDADPGWATEGLWAFGVPQGNNFDPIGGFTGDKVYGYNLAGQYENNLPVRYLTTTSIDLGGVTGSQLEFYRWLGVESAIFDSASLDISTNGSGWTTLWAHTGGNVLDLDWLQQVFDISAIADDEPTVYLRWGMGPTDSSATFAGWNIDDVKIFGTLALAPGDIDGDGDLDAIDMRSFAACQNGPAAAPAPPAPMLVSDCLAAFDFNGDGFVDLGDYEIFSQTYTGSGG